MSAIIQLSGYDKATLLQIINRNLKILKLILKLLN